METLASPWFVPVLGVVCYLGAVLYGGVVSVSGRYADQASWALIVYYIAFFPTGIGSSLWLVQSAVLAVVGVSIGPDIVYRFLERKREYTHAPGGIKLPWWQRVVVALPAFAVLVWTLWYAQRHVLAARGDLVALNAAMAPIWGVLTTQVGGYFAVAYGLGTQVFRRDFDRMPLLRTSMRFHQMNGFGALGGPCLGAIFYVYGPYSTVGQSTVLVMLLTGLAPGLNELAWSYDAVLTRILTAHVVAAAAAGIVFFVPGWLEWLGGGVLLKWVATLVVLAIVAMAVPSRVEARMLGWFFPRAAESRARLAGLMSEPFAATNRAEVAAALLDRVVETLDAEGGAIVLPALGADEMIFRVSGNVDREVLGPAGDAARWVSEVATGPSPVWYESLPAAHRAKMLLGGVVLLCPLGSGSNGAILLGPRRGWLYDARTIQALQTVGQQARFAFDNLSLARARAHGEKLEALGEAAARIAHEIRNPLSAARSLVQLAGADDPSARELSEPAIEELDRIGRLVGDLLSFARREDVLQATDFDLPDACRDALAQVVPLCEAAAIRVETELEAVRVHADRDRIAQVLANLARNSVEAMSQNQGGRLLLRCGVENGFAFAELYDDGPGIPADRRQTIFEPFHTSKREGTGLGLAIAQRIARAHGGELALVVGDEPGTRFRLTLPTG